MICKYCGAEFVGRRADALFCSNAHKMAFHRHQQPTPRNETRPQLLPSGQLDRIETMLKKQSELLAALSQRGVSVQTTTITTTQIAPLGLEEIDFSITQAKSDEVVGWNLQLSIAQIQENFLALPLETLEYGLKRGGFNVTPDHIEQKKSQLAKRDKLDLKTMERREVDVTLEGSAKAIANEVIVPEEVEIEIDW